MSPEEESWRRTLRNPEEESRRGIQERRLGKESRRGVPERNLREKSQRAIQERNPGEEFQRATRGKESQRAIQAPGEESRRGSQESRLKGESRRQERNPGEEAGRGGQKRIPEGFQTKSVDFSLVLQGKRDFKKRKCHSRGQGPSRWSQWKRALLKANTSQQPLRWPPIAVQFPIFIEGKHEYR